MDALFHAGAHSRRFQVIADVLERAASTDPDAVVAAIRKTSFGGGVTVSTAMLDPRAGAARGVAPGRGRAEFLTRVRRRSAT
jgi:hypothetical protein